MRNDTPNPPFDKPVPFTCFKCGDGNTRLYCLNCAREHEKKLLPIQEFVLNHLQEELNSIGGVVGYKLILNPDETEALIKLLDNGYFWRS